MGSGVDDRIDIYQFLHILVRQSSCILYGHLIQVVMQCSALMDHNNYYSNASTC